MKRPYWIGWQKPIGDARKEYRFDHEPTLDDFAQIEVVGRIAYLTDRNLRDGGYIVQTHPKGWKPEYYSDDEMREIIAQCCPEVRDCDLVDDIRPMKRNARTKSASAA